MLWLIAIIAIVLILGPLRHSVGRHWALLLSVSAGAVVGWGAGMFVLSRFGCTTPHLPLLWALAGAVAFLSAGPAWLRKTQQDGRDEQSSRRH